MNVSIRPELAERIEEQVKSGRYPTAEHAVNAALDRVLAEERLLSEDLDDEDVAAIEEGLAQLDRGEARPWEEVRAELVQKYLRG